MILALKDVLLSNMAEGLKLLVHGTSLDGLLLELLLLLKADLLE